MKINVKLPWKNVRKRSIGAVHVRLIPPAKIPAEKCLNQSNCGSSMVLLLLLLLLCFFMLE